MKTVLNIKTDKEVKVQAQKIAKEIGVPLSTVVNAYLKEFIRSSSITFTTIPRLNKEVVALFEEAEKESLQDRKKNSPRFDNSEDTISYLRST